MVLLVSCCLLTLERCSFENISIVMLLFYCHTFPHAYWTEVAYSSKRTYSHMKKKKTCALFQFQCPDLPFPRVSSLQCLGVGALVGALLTLHEKLISAICSHCLIF